MAKNRILHVFASLDRGGAESRIMDLYRKINRDVIQFDFVVNQSEKQYAYVDEIKKLGGRIFYLPRYHISGYFAYKKIWADLLKKHPEWRILHIHHTSNTIAYIDVIKKNGRQVIVHSRTAGGEQSFKSMIKRITRYPLRFKADHLFACSLNAAKWMFGKESAKAHVIQNAIDIAPFIYHEATRDVMRKELKIEDKIVIGHIGRFTVAKNHEFLIDIFAKIRKNKPNATLLLVGDGNLRTQIENKAKAMGILDHVIFTGVRTDISRLVQAMDVFLFPSLFEGLPGSVIEAQAAGLPCVISDTITEEVKITNLVKVLSLNETHQTWAFETLLALEKHHRQNTRNQIRAAGFDASYVADQLTEFYLEILK